MRVHPPSRRDHSPSASHRSTRLKSFSTASKVQARRSSRRSAQRRSALSTPSLVHCAQGVSTRLPPAADSSRDRLSRNGRCRMDIGERACRCAERVRTAAHDHSNLCAAAIRRTSSVTPLSTHPLLACTFLSRNREAVAVVELIAKAAVVVARQKALCGHAHLSRVSPQEAGARAEHAVRRSLLRKS
jgi:hypothetical protein